jgi:hypothetical protein
MDLVNEKFRGVYNKNGSALKKEGEAERALNLMRAILKVCEGLNKYPEAQSHVAYNEMFNHMMSNKDVPKLKEIYEQIV